MSLSQASLRKSPAGGDLIEESVDSGATRMVPASKSLLERIDTQLSAPQKTKDVREQQRRQILERCGCL